MLTAVERGAGRVLELAGWGAKISAMAIVVVVTANVALRYGLSMGTVAMQELQWHLVPPIAMLGMAYGLHNGEHVRVDVFYERMPRRLQGMIDLVTCILTVAIAAYLAWLAVPFVERSFNMGEGSANPSGLPYRYVLKAFLPVGFGLLAIQGGAGAVRAVRELCKPHSTARGGHREGASHGE